MIKLSPTFVINCSRKLTQLAESLHENAIRLDDKNLSLDSRVRSYSSLEVSVMNCFDYVFKLKEHADNWVLLVHQLEEATGESAEKLLESNYSDEYYEQKFIDYYAKLTVDSKETGVIDSSIYLLNEIYDFGLDGENYSEKLEFALAKAALGDEYISEFKGILGNFDYAKYGFSSMDEVLDDMVRIYMRNGFIDAYLIAEKLLWLPDNYIPSNFDPTIQLKDDDYYGYYPLECFETNSENITVNGYVFDIAQVLPENCTKLEQVYYNFLKDEVIKTLSSLPDNYLKAASMGKSNAIVLTCSQDAMFYGSGDWGGYYTFIGTAPNTIVINCQDVDSYVGYYTNDIVIHEIGHKFDDMMFDNIIDDSNMVVYHTEASSEWSNYYEKYQHVLPSLVDNGYSVIPNSQEFFAESAVAYFKNPEGLKQHCEEVYNAFEKLLLEFNQ